MKVKEVLEITDSLVWIYTPKAEYSYFVRGLFGGITDNYELRRVIGLFREAKISDEEKEEVLNQEIRRISSNAGRSSGSINLYTKGA